MGLPADTTPMPGSTRALPQPAHRANTTTAPQPPHLQRGDGFAHVAARHPGQRLQRAITQRYSLSCKGRAQRRCGGAVRVKVGSLAGLLAGLLAGRLLRTWKRKPAIYLRSPLIHPST
jgi:hypothetical protein